MFTLKFDYNYFEYYIENKEKQVHYLEGMSTLDIAILFGYTIDTKESPGKYIAKIEANEVYVTDMTNIF